MTPAEQNKILVFYGGTNPEISGALREVLEGKPSSNHAQPIGNLHVLRRMEDTLLQEHPAFKSASQTELSGWPLMEKLEKAVRQQAASSFSLATSKRTSPIASKKELKFLLTTQLGLPFSHCGRLPPVALRPTFHSRRLDPPQVLEGVGYQYNVRIGTQEILFSLPEHPHPGLKIPDLQSVARAIAATPDPTRALLKRVVFQPEPNEEAPSATFAVPLRVPDTLYVYPVTPGELAHLPARTQSGYDDAVGHEFNHLFAKSFSSPADVEAGKIWPLGWEAACIKDAFAPSGYSTTEEPGAYAEDFAEARLLYVRTRGDPAHSAELRALMPNRWALLDAVSHISSSAPVKPRLSH